VPGQPLSTRDQADRESVTIGLSSHKHDQFLKKKAANRLRATRKKKSRPQIVTITMQKIVKDIGKIYSDTKQAFE